MGLLEGEELNFEYECGKGGNDSACAPIAIGEVVGDVEFISASSFHELEAFGPTRDHLVEGEACGLLAAVGAVKDPSGNEFAFIVDGYIAVGCWFFTVSFFDDFVDQPRSGFLVPLLFSGFFKVLFPFDFSRVGRYIFKEGIEGGLAGFESSGFIPDTTDFQAFDGDWFLGFVLEADFYICDFIHHFNPFDDFAENGVPTIQMACFFVGDEELASIGRRAGVGHRKDAFSSMFEGGVGFIAELVARATSARTLWATALDHEIFDDAVKCQAIVVRAFAVYVHSAFCQAYKAAYGEGAFFKFQGEDDFAVVGSHVRIEAVGLLCGEVGLGFSTHENRCGEKGEGLSVFHILCQLVCRWKLDVDGREYPGRFFSSLNMPVVLSGYMDFSDRL